LAIFLTDLEVVTNGWDLNALGYWTAAFAVAAFGVG
jgi:hypothetical protein